VKSFFLIVSTYLNCKDIRLNSILVSDKVANQIAIALFVPKEEIMFSCLVVAINLSGNELKSR